MRRHLAQLTLLDRRHLEHLIRVDLHHFLTNDELEPHFFRYEHPARVGAHHYLSLQRAIVHAVAAEQHCAGEIAGQ